MPLNDAEQLIRENVERAYTFARWYSRNHRYLDDDEVITAALDGLEAAADCYVTSRDTTFWTYAKPRIRGKIQDLARAPTFRRMPLDKEHVITIDDNARQRLLIWSILIHLDDRERHIVLGYYFRNLSMQQIADELGLSASRIRKLHTQIVSTLRRQLASDTVNDNNHLENERHVG